MWPARKDTRATRGQYYRNKLPVWGNKGQFRRNPYPCCGCPDMLALWRFAATDAGELARFGCGSAWWAIAGRWLPLNGGPIRCLRVGPEGVFCTVMLTGLHPTTGYVPAVSSHCAGATSSAQLRGGRRYATMQPRPGMWRNGRRASLRNLWSNP